MEKKQNEKEKRGKVGKEKEKMSIICI